jgi:hypothetical protein|tara:strand:+ start:454 stop:696 length:243 start_codon:yes stop_codon:yes gene_type:complete|mmetsp:Transcript_5580/g.24790  ORF Transcript_5580/g.24790 Transcript_5580/m.24790 type:complete len:81 (+) Transcript_5580:311-553(+)
MGVELGVSGVNVATAAAEASKPGVGPKMATGERLSMCGQYVISRRGEWRPVPEGERVATRCAFDAAEPDTRRAPAGEAKR